MSERLRHADGTPCDEDGIARLLGSPAEGSPESVYLAWDDARIEVGTLRRDDVPGKFGFEPAPRAGSASLDDAD